MKDRIERFTADEVNQLIMLRDPSTLWYFHLENASEKELLYFDARCLPEQELPIKRIHYEPPDEPRF